jgi:hypothetical protein
MPSLTDVDQQNEAAQPRGDGLVNGSLGKVTGFMTQSEGTPHPLLSDVPLLHCKDTRAHALRRVTIDFSFPAVHSFSFQTANPSTFDPRRHQLRPGRLRRAAPSLLRRVPSARHRQ